MSLPTYPQLLSGIRDNVNVILAGSLKSPQLNHIIGVCHSLAIACLNMKKAKGRLHLAGTLAISDLAYDCIAELFQQDESGGLPRLKVYLSSLDLDDSTDEDLLAYLRRLVFSAVNQRLFRLYGELDPAVGGILRNVKLAVRSLRQFDEVEKLGELCITPALCDPLSHLPFIEQYHLRTEMNLRLRGTEHIPEILSVLSIYLRQQSGHSRMVPILDLAHTLRDMYAIKRIDAGGGTEAENDGMTTHIDVSRSLKWASDAIRRKAEHKYVERGEVPKELLDKYFLAIRDYLEGKLDGGSEDLSLFESFLRVVPGSDRASYNRCHRARIEYLTRQIESLVLRRLRGS